MEWLRFDRTVVMRAYTVLDYRRSLQLQRHLQMLRREEGIQDTLLLLEHPPVITLGRHASRADILLSADGLQDHGISVHVVERGGQATYHGPGQLVAYLLIHLYDHRKNIRLFVYQMEQVIIELLRNYYSITATRNKHFPGVWVGKQKIAAVGISISGGVTMHGIALNVQPNLRHFNFIIPCGIRGYGVTSIKSCLGHTVDMAKLMQEFAVTFKQIFGYRRLIRRFYDWGDSKDDASG